MESCQKNTRVTPLTSEQLLVRDAQAGIRVYMEESLAMIVIYSSGSSNGTDSSLSALLERLVLKSLDKVLRTPPTWETITDAVLHNPGFNTIVAASVKSEHNGLTADHA